MIILIIIIIIIIPAALPSQLSIKTSDSSIVEDPKAHDGKKNPISNYPVEAEILCYDQACSTTSKRLNPCKRCCQIRNWHSSCFQMGKGRMAGGEWPNQTAQSHIFTPEQPKDPDNRPVIWPAAG